LSSPFMPCRTTTQWPSSVTMKPCKGQASFPCTAACLRRNNTSAEVRRPEREIGTPRGTGRAEAPG
jgi:hypothetical protein